MTTTPKPQTGMWILTAPNGKQWQADSPLKVCGAEQRERVPAEVGLSRVLAAIAQPANPVQIPTVTDTDVGVALHASATMFEYSYPEKMRRALEAFAASKAQPVPTAQWQPIDTAAKDGRTLLLGYHNSHNKWRILRGQWMSNDYILKYWQDSGDAEAGWFETVVESDNLPNCWQTFPTHWMPLPPELAAIAQPADSTPKLHVGESSFEDWYQAYARQGISKQVARDAYAAGMGDPLVTYAQPVQSNQALQAIARLLQVHEGRKPEDALKIAAALIGAQPVQPAAVGAVLTPHYRGYANLGSGQYVLNHTADLPAELIISIATEEEKAGRAVGDSRGLEPRAILHPEDMAVRLRFENVAGLDALEQQLRFLREELFPESIVGTK